MSKRLERRRGWFLLVARPRSGAPPVGFFPLKDGKRTNRRHGAHVQITMPGRGAADYTGFICEPEYQKAVGRAFAEHLLGLDWKVLSLECLRASEQRMSGFFKAFKAPRFEVERKSLEMASGIDNAICPYADLPEDWDSYLAKLSSNTRQRLRRLLRAIDGVSVRVTLADANTFERDLEILLRMWAERWGSLKGDRLESILESTREELSDALANGTLFLPVLWRGDAAVGATTCMMDFTKRELLFQLGARDPAAEDISPGVLLHAWTIRTAIERGFVRYDFMRGNEPYKYTFATGERRIESIELHRSKLRPWRGRASAGQHASTAATDQAKRRPA